MSLVNDIKRNNENGHLLGINIQMPFLDKGLQDDAGSSANQNAVCKTSETVFYIKDIETL